MPNEFSLESEIHFTLFTFYVLSTLKLRRGRTQNPINHKRLRCLQMSMLFQMYFLFQNMNLLKM